MITLHKTEIACQNNTLSIFFETPPKFHKSLFQGSPCLIKGSQAPPSSPVVQVRTLPPGPYTDFLKEFADFLSDLLVNADKALIVGDFNIHVDNPNFGVKQNITHRYNHTLDLIIWHGIDLTDIDIVPQSDDVTDHFLVSCMLRITNINCRAPRYRPGRTIVPATRDRFTNNLPDLSQLLCAIDHDILIDRLQNYTGIQG